MPYHFEQHLIAEVIISAGRIAVTIQSIPGTASLSLYTINGRMVFDFPEIYSSTGMFTFTINKNVLPQQTSNLCIARVSLNGSDAGAFRLTI